MIKNGNQKQPKIERKRAETLVRMAIHKQTTGLCLTYYTHNLLTRSDNNECEIPSATAPKLKITIDGKAYRFPIVYGN